MSSVSDQSIVRNALKELAAARLREGWSPKVWTPVVREEEAALNRLCSLLLDIEGSLLAYWTDIPEREIQRLQPLIREAINGFEDSLTSQARRQPEG